MARKKPALTDEMLIEKGYKEWPPSRWQHKDIEKFFQKRIRDDKGTRYFIDVEKWKEVVHPYTGETFPSSYVYKAQLYKRGTHDAFDMEFHSSWDLDDVEAFLENLFESSGCDYYEEDCQSLCRKSLEF